MEEHYNSLKNVNSSANSLAIGKIKKVATGIAMAAYLTLGSPTNVNANMVKASEETLCYTDWRKIEKNKYDYLKTICKGDIAYILFGSMEEGGISVKFDRNGKAQKCKCVKEITKGGVFGNSVVEKDVVYLDDGK